MRKMLKAQIAAACLGCCLAAAPLAAQDSDFDRAEAALVAVWEAMPLEIRNVTFAAGNPGGYGIYEPRASSVFGPGEQILVYAEPLGYGWRAQPDGTFAFGFEVDVVILDPDRRVLFEQPNFERLHLVSRHRNREFMLTLTLNLTGAPAGDYILEYRVRDTVLGKAGVISLPFSLVEG